MIREARVTLGGRTTRYLDAGVGRPILLLHAFPLNADMWRPQLAHVPSGWRMVAPDLLGFGLSPRPPGAPPPTIDEVAGDLDALMYALEIRAAVIAGLSMGGYVAFALFRRAPQRFTGMVLADTKAQADTQEGREGRRKMIDLVREGGARAVADQMLPKLLGPTSHDSRPEVALAVRQMIEAAPVSAIADASRAMMGRPDSIPDLAAARCPGLVIVGAEDAITPATDAAVMHRAIAGSRMVVLPGVGHLSSLEAPDAFSSALSGFLQSGM